MSYSRWSNSYWYTFHSACSPPLDRNNQIFEVCYITQFTWYELVHKRRECLAIVKEKCKEVYKLGWQPTDEEMKELEGYMIEFISDIVIDFIMNEIKTEALLQKLKNTWYKEKKKSITLNSEEILFVLMHFEDMVMF